MKKSLILVLFTTFVVISCQKLNNDTLITSDLYTIDQDVKKVSVVYGTDLNTFFSNVNKPVSASVHFVKGDRIVNSNEAFIEEGYKLCVVPLSAEPDFYEFEIQRFATTQISSAVFEYGEKSFVGEINEALGRITFSVDSDVVSGEIGFEAADYGVVTDISISDLETGLNDLGGVMVTANDGKNVREYNLQVTRASEPVIPEPVVAGFFGFDSGYSSDDSLYSFLPFTNTNTQTWHDGVEDGVSLDSVVKKDGAASLRLVNNEGNDDYGSGNYLKLGDYDLGDVFTLSVDFRLDSNVKSSINTIIANGASYESSNGFKVFINRWATTERRIVFEAGNGTVGGKWISAPGIVEYDTWYNIVLVVDKANKSVNVYLDGTLVEMSFISEDSFIAESEFDFGFHTDGEISVGGFVDGYHFFNGWIDNLRFFDSALSADQVSQL
ncbi:MAG: LamG domain-containing protein [Spirochaetales bacterium]|nr:LamG domain-containing protein [Spirochaetales bacterium]